MNNDKFIRDVSHQATMPVSRIYYLDWLRALAVLGVVAYHAVLPFARTTWSIVNDQQSETLQAFVFVLESFGLAVLFVIAGAGVRFSFRGAPCSPSSPSGPNGFCFHSPSVRSP